MSIVKHIRLIGKVAMLSMLALGGVILIDYGYEFWREYQGYCRNSDTILSAQERFDRALDHYLLNQRRRDLLEIGAVEIADRRASTQEIEKDFVIVPYASREDFLAANPQCCRLTWQTPSGPIGAWQKAALGWGDGWFEFSHKIRYMDRGGVPKEIAATRTYYQVDNCGNPTPKFYH